MHRNERPVADLHAALAIDDGIGPDENSIPEDDLPSPRVQDCADLQIRARTEPHRTVATVAKPAGYANVPAEVGAGSNPDSME